MSFWNKFRHFANTTRFKTTLWYSLIFLLLEILLALLTYYQLYNTLSQNLDVALTKQATAIMRIVKEKKFDLDVFIPDSVYKAPEEFVWDIIFEEVAYERRNNFIQINYKDSVIFKSASLYAHRLSFPDQKKSLNLFDFQDTSLSENKIRCVQLKEKKFTVIVAFPHESIASVLAGLEEAYKILLPLFLLISLAGGAIISQRALSRIDAIIKKTEEITAQNLDEKIEGEEYEDEYGRLVGKMNEMIKRIKISIDYMNQFSISAAHELKTPLTILRGEIELSLKSKKTPEQYVEVLKSSYEETLRLIKIVDNLFFISKIDHTLISIKKEPTNIDQFLSDIVNSLQILGSEKNMELKLRSNTGKIVEIDKELIRQALINLIDNAIKYGEENKPILITTELAADKIKINIINEGESIPEESIPKIFDRFYRVEGSRNRKTGGVGLGLAVVKAIVTWHEAELEVDSKKGKYTRFSIIL